MMLGFLGIKPDLRALWCSLFRYLDYTYYWLQPPPSLPRMGGTVTLGCLIFNGLPTNKSNLHLPFGGEREGTDVMAE